MTVIKHLYLRVFSLAQILLFLHCIVGETSKAVQAQEAAVNQLLQQLDDRHYSVRQSAFVRLCDRALPWDQELEREAKGLDRQRAGLAGWIQKLRRLPGPIEERFELMSDYQALTRGDESVMQKYISRGRVDRFCEMIALVPDRPRELLRQAYYNDNSFDAVIRAAWRDGSEECIPKLLNAILPDGPIRVGVNRRWRILGMPSDWKVDIPLDIPSVKLADLYLSGKVDEAIAYAKSAHLAKELEELLMREGRWDEWLKLIPEKSEDAPKWMRGSQDRINRAFILESLGRHDEAVALYQEETSRADDTDQVAGQAIKAFFGLLTSDARFEDDLRKHSKEDLVAYYLDRNEVELALKEEDLLPLTEAVVSKWLDSKLKGNNPAYAADPTLMLSRLARFQLLFERMGYASIAEMMSTRIDTMIEALDEVSQWRQYEALMYLYPRENKLKLLRKLGDRIDQAVSKRNELKRVLDKNGRPNGNSIGSVSTIFIVAFDQLKLSSINLFRTLRESPSVLASPLEAINLLDELNQGRMPNGWDRTKLEEVIESTIRKMDDREANADDEAIEFARLLNAMGHNESALKLLSGHAASQEGQLLTADLCSKLGQHETAADLSMQMTEIFPASMPNYFAALKHCKLAGRYDDWLMLQRRFLSGMDWWSNYPYDDRKDPKLQDKEYQSELQFAVELNWTCAPSNWLEINYFEAYQHYCAAILAQHYLESVKHDTKDAVALGIVSRVQMIGFSQSLLSNLNPRGAEKNRRSSAWNADLARSARTIERMFASCIWEYVVDGDREKSDSIIRTCHRLNPEQINTLIDIAPLARKKLGEGLLREWYELYLDPMKQHLEQFPNDQMVANNIAWLAAKCGFDLDYAYQLSSNVVEGNATDTYMDTLAEVEFARGNIGRAIELSERCRAMNPRSEHHKNQLKRFRAR